MTPEEVIEALKGLAGKKHHDYNLTQREDYLQDHEALTEAIRLIEAGKKGLNNEPTAHSIA
jgi:hypothetical protein